MLRSLVGSEMCIRDRDSTEFLKELGAAVQHLQTQVKTLTEENAALKEKGNKHIASNHPVSPTRKLPGVAPPAPLTFMKSNREETWRLWRQQWQNYVTLSKLSDAPNDEQLAMFESRMSLDALKLVNQ